MKKILLAIAAVAALTGSHALAADLPVPGPPPPPVAPPWAGFYIGINGGEGWGHETWTFPSVQFFNTKANQSFTTNPNGAVLGGQAGYNFQMGPWVVGVEITGDWSGLSQTLVGPVTPVFPTDKFTTKVQDYETFTARLGYAPGWGGFGAGGLLWYVKAGGATAGVNLNAISGPPISGVTFSNSQRLGGGTVGGGLEFMWTPHFVFGVEYDYIALAPGSFSRSAACTAPGTCAPGFTTPMTVNSGIFGISSVVGRLSYKF